MSGSSAVVNQAYRSIQMLSPAVLSEVIDRPAVATAELTPFLAELLRHDPSVPTRPASAALSGVAGLFGGFVIPGSGGFDDPLWAAYQRVWGTRWHRGEFSGAPTLSAPGGRNYIFRKDKEQPFSFVRHTGEVVTPGGMVTDDGSIPRVAWAIPGLDPWTFTPAFLIHDWEFLCNHCTPGYAKSFEEVTATLCEGVYTMMMDRPELADWRVLVAIHTGVSSFIGRRLWGRQWTPDQCSLMLGV